LYRFLGRAIWEIDEPYRFLLTAMRLWVERARTGQCPCAALAGGFTQRGAAAGLRDFGIAMAAIDRDALGQLSFGARGCLSVREDEARLLALFEVAIGGEPDRTRRIASSIVKEDAVAPLATAVERVSLHLAQGVIEERDQ
jgi:hypothetical protein